MTGLLMSLSFFPAHPRAAPPSTYCPRIEKNSTKNMLQIAAKPKPFASFESRYEAAAIARIPITSEIILTKLNDHSRVRRSSSKYGDREDRSFAMDSIAYFLLIRGGCKETGSKPPVQKQGEMKSRERRPFPIEKLNIHQLILKYHRKQLRAST